MRCQKGNSGVIRLLLAFLLFSTPALADNELVKTHAPVHTRPVAKVGNLTRTQLFPSLYGSKAVHSVNDTCDDSKFGGVSGAWVTETVCEYAKSFHASD